MDDVVFATSCVTIFQSYQDDERICAVKCYNIYRFVRISLSMEFHPTTLWFDVRDPNH